MWSSWAHSSVRTGPTHLFVRGTQSEEGCLNRTLTNNMYNMGRRGSLSCALGSTLGWGADLSLQCCLEVRDSGCGLVVFPLFKKLLSSLGCSLVLGRRVCPSIEQIVLFHICGERISRHCQAEEGFMASGSPFCFCGSLNFPGFAWKIVRQFVGQCETAGMRINTSKPEAMVLSWQKVECPLQVREELLS